MALRMIETTMWIMGIGISSLIKVANAHSISHLYSSRIFLNLFDLKKRRKISLISLNSRDIISRDIQRYSRATLSLTHIEQKLLMWQKTVDL